VADFREYGNKPTGSVKSRKFNNHVSDNQLLKNDSAGYSSYFLQHVFPRVYKYFRQP
jgi:hypothetical protein